MKTLTIADLARSAHLDRPTMTAVRGGWRVAAPTRPFGERIDVPRILAPDGGSPITATQDLGQAQDAMTATARDAASIDGGPAAGPGARDGDHKIVRR